MLDEILNSSGDMDLVKTKSMEENECFFFITVWNLSAIPCICREERTSVGSTHIVENAPITENMIAKAVEDAGGSVTENGFYPINGEIEDILISELEKIEEDKERR